MDRTHLLIESRDPWTRRVDEGSYALARSLRFEGADVTLVLVQDGVLATRSSQTLEELRAHGVRIVADRFALRERAIDEDTLPPEIETDDLDCVLDALERGAQALWY